MSFISINVAVVVIFAAMRVQPFRDQACTEHVIIGGSVLFRTRRRQTRDCFCFGRRRSRVSVGLLGIGGKSIPLSGARRVGVLEAAAAGANVQQAPGSRIARDENPLAARMRSDNRHHNGQ